MMLINVTKVLIADRLNLSEMIISQQFTNTHPIMTNKLYICFFLSVFSVSINSVLGLTNINGTECQEQSVCDYYVEGSVCTAGVCACPNGLLISGDGSKCIPPADGYGAPCLENIQCSATLGSGGSCSSSTCACATTHHYRSGLCWKNVPLNGKCFDDAQCYASYDFVGVSCQNGVCKCRGEYYEREMACRRKRINGENCAVDEDCCPSNNPTNPHGICNTRVCQCQNVPTLAEPKQSKLSGIPFISTDELDCNPGYFLKNNVCVPEIGTSCSDDNDLCKGGVTEAICIDNRECGCNGTLVVRSFSNRNCNKIAIVYNGACSESGQCAMFGGNAICDTVGTKKVCVCEEESHFDTTNQICRKSKHINDACTINEECFAPSGNIECNSNICQCQNGTHAADSQQDCRPDANLVNDKCQEDEDCLFANSLCNEMKQCECQEHYFNEDGLCRSGIGSPCTVGEECSVHLTSCINSNSSCQCAEEYVPSNDFSTCLPRVGANEECQQTDQCDISMGLLRECRNGACICEENAQYVQNKCYFIKKLGEKCSARAECIYPGDSAGAYICQNSICACQYGYLPNGDQCFST